METSFIISPRSLFGSPKKFEFESQNAKDYIDTLEQNLSHHSSLITQLLKKQSKDAENIDKDLNPPMPMEEIVEDILNIYKQLKNIENERKVFVSKVLINELVEHEQREKQVEVIEDYEERLQEARFHIDRKDKLIYDLQKQNSELELQITYKQNSDGSIIVPLQQDILEHYEKVESIRVFLADLEQKIGYGVQYKESLLEFYKKTWTKAQMLQALLRNPVNVKEGFGKVSRLEIENEEPDLTIEFEESDIEDQCHFRACTLGNDSLESPGHKRSTLSSGNELIINVRNKLLNKILNYEKKVGLHAIEIQKVNDELYEMGRENFELLKENVKIAKMLKKMSY